MKVKALVSFSGSVTMSKDEVKVLPKNVADDLLQAGHVEEVVVKKQVKTDAG
ncbi:MULTISPECIES: hypothetical protein [Lysinibacillus]|uniref:Uncharacterized protein n=1 Tax=Lysinibacillus sphaericus TaxID=1421 RepID=A0AAJ4ZY87_LYSSH|nr:MULTISPECIES: hypothetical protein [Lysinibacillus]MED4543176.1 hypothetical protein [Lysinibacillus sphaericus]MED4545932.1 hypothetical protein [Lysinibacillus sphaericus]SUV15367.1 Uncharacterised protein [Lysinibacillus sphaericus]SUV18695.1 Uncharacterised protein [Lysinibacillus sphaericus]GEC84681.1 hypothetical protein LSP03_44240 [Lysinibacillus sphaericus]